MYVPKHRLDTTTDAALDASVETAIQTARLSRRGVLGAVAVVGITGGAASATSFAPSKKRHMFHNKGRVVNKGKPHPNRTPSPSPAASATSSPTASATPTGTASATPTATASATPTATASATPTATASATPTATASATPTATATATPTATPTATASATPTPTSSPTVSSGTGLAMVGMSTPATLWAQRVSEVGPGLASRRIFADLASGAGSQIKLVEAAHAAGMLPVISYKVGGDIAGAVAGKYNAVAEQAAAKLASYGYPTAVTFWHEPNPDISAADYVKASKQLLPAFKQGKLKVGPILNGWLLDNQQSLFASFAPDEMFELWDWFGIDTYESGTASSPGKVKPAVRIPALADFVKSRGANLPLGVGEYNGWSGTTIAAVGEALMTTPNVWFGCVFNNDAALGSVLTGDRLTAFRQTLADPRSAAPRTA